MFYCLCECEFVPSVFDATNIAYQIDVKSGTEKCYRMASSYGKSYPCHTYFSFP